MRQKTIHISHQDEKIISLMARDRKTSVKKILDGVIADAAHRMREGDESIMDRMDELETRNEKLRAEAKIAGLQKKISAINSKMQDDDLY